MAISLFLTAYDPVDLPGGSIDPMGYLAPYLALADELLPGLTGAAAQPSYLPVLCAGIRLVDEHHGRQIATMSATQRRRVRVEGAQRFERLWALASLLAAEHGDDTDGDAVATGAIDLPGLRGITYVRRALERQSNQPRINVNYPLLARQYTYGMMGIYGTVASELHLVEKPEFSLTPSLGEPVAEAFLEDTTIGEDTLPRKRLMTLTNDPNGTVRPTRLRQWGKRAIAGRRFPEPLAGHVRDALVASARRRYSLQLFEAVAEQTADLGDIATLRACRTTIDASPPSNAPGGIDLVARRVLDAILALDDSYRWSMLLFERLLRLARDSGDTCSLSTATQDSVVAQGLEHFRDTGADVDATCRGLIEVQLGATATRVRNVAQFGEQLAQCASTTELVDAVLQRHQKLQGSKRDRGRAKLPWIERRGDHLAITSARAGGRNDIVTDPNQIPPADWRVSAVRGFLHAVGGVS